MARRLFPRAFRDIISFTTKYSNRLLRSSPSDSKLRQQCGIACHSPDLFFSLLGTRQQNGWRKSMDDGLDGDFVSYQKIDRKNTNELKGCWSFCTTAILVTAFPLMVVNWPQTTAKTLYRHVHVSKGVCPPASGRSPTRLILLMTLTYWGLLFGIVVFSPPNWTIRDEELALQPLLSAINGAPFDVDFVRTNRRQCWVHVLPNYISVHSVRWRWNKYGLIWEWLRGNNNWSPWK